jgi:hypothetical protein
MGNKQRLRAGRRRLDGQNLSVKVSVAGEEDPEGIEVDLGVPEDDAASLSPGGAAAAEEGGVEVPIEDDDDPSGDPLAELQRQYKEAQTNLQATEARVREKEAAEARYRAEAEQARSEREATDARYRDEQKRRDELEAFRITAEREQLVSHKAVLEHALAAAGNTQRAAQRDYSEAMAAGDYERAAEHQAVISNAVFERHRYTEGLDRLNEQIEAPLQEYRREPEPDRPVQQQAPQADQFEAAIASLGEADKRWLRAHKADITNPRREQLLRSFAIQAETSVDDGGYGLTPGSPEYHQFLDEAMGYSDGGQAADPEPAAAAPPARRAATPKRPTAAPASRATASASTQKVFLTEFDRQTARDLKMTEEDYARNYKSKSQQDQLTAAQTNGRLMARYTSG